MWNLLGVLFVAFIGSAYGEEITLSCRYELSSADEYVCVLQDVEVLEPSQPVTLTGDHIEGYNNDDVDIVLISQSNTPFIIPQIFTKFPNLVELHIIRSNLQLLHFPEAANLTKLVVVGNKITKLENETFSGQLRLRYLVLVANQIAHIEEDAFIGLADLFSLTLIGNEITDIFLRTFHPLTGVTVIDLEANRLTSIGPEVFARCRSLDSLYLEYNQIDKIAPSFAENIKRNLRYVKLNGNTCVSSQFPLGSDEQWEELNTQLQTCFDNFNETPPNETRRITLEFTGNMAIFDENGNLITRI